MPETLERSMEPQAEARHRECHGCKKRLKEREVFSFQERAFCQDCYLGKKALGPIGDQYIECPHCKTTLHRFTVVCYNCHNSIRVIGKVEAEARGFGVRVMIFAIAVLMFIIAVVALGPVGVQRGGSAGRSLLYSILGPLCALSGLFRVLFPRALRKVRALAGIGSFFLAVLLIIGGTLMVVLLPFP